MQRGEGMFSWHVPIALVELNSTSCFAGGFNWYNNKPYIQHPRYELATRVYDTNVVIYMTPMQMYKRMSIPDGIWNIEYNEEKCISVDMQRYKCNNT